MLYRKRFTVTKTDDRISLFTAIVAGLIAGVPVAIVLRVLHII